MTGLFWMQRAILPSQSTRRRTGLQWGNLTLWTRFNLGPMRQMASPSSTSPLGLLLSGGLDSSILLYHSLAQGARVQPLYVQSGLLWQQEELRAVRRFLAALARPELADLVVFEMPLADLYAGHWSVTGDGTPDSKTPDEAVYLPGRNALLLIKPILWCQAQGISQLALAPLASNPFADATDEFFSELQSALNQGVACPVEIERPFARLHKPEVMRLGRGAPLAHTFSCIHPVDGLHCGQCNKCAERQVAFRDVGWNDPTRYAVKH